MLDVIQVSSLEKVLYEYKKPKKELKEISGFKNERLSYQIAYLGEPRTYYTVKVKSPIKKYVTVREVMDVPVSLTCYENGDDDFISKKPGLFPDLLYPLEKSSKIVSSNLWRSLWITVDLDGSVPAGKYDIEIIFQNENEKVSKVMMVEVIDALLPEQEMSLTQWFHTDCIATAHDVKVFSKKHWQLIESYVKTAVRNGIDTILTPVFTPPLDTQIGKERPTVQLIDVEVVNGKYKFGFSRFEKWIELLDRCGVRNFEISHLFTQWGAKTAPKIVAKCDGKMKRIFGWDTPAVGGEYEKFLDCFLPELIKEIKKLGIKERCWFHVSDEPHLEHLENYLKAKNIIERNIDGMIIRDALSNYDFYKDGVVKDPIPATNHIEEFLENKVPNLWTYYCCGQEVEVCNRFIAMPSYRNRAIGPQLYVHNIKGFLQWGYNFYYSQYSKRVINPYFISDALFAFPGGDAFSVYPGKDGALESLRICVFYDALQDMRAMKLLESYKGKEYVEGIIAKYWKEPVTFKTYPKSSAAILGLREEINKEIKKCL